MCIVILNCNAFDIAIIGELVEGKDNIITFIDLLLAIKFAMALCHKNYNFDSWKLKVLTDLFFIKDSQMIFILSSENLLLFKLIRLIY